MPSFSKRHGHREAAAPITIREGAPQELRTFVLLMAKRAGLGHKQLREIICEAVHSAPDPGNWKENDWMWQEIEGHLYHNAWFYTYDAIEMIYAVLGEEEAETFADKVNFYMRRYGIGWQLEEGQIKYRGDDEFEDLKTAAIHALDTAGKTTAKTEIKEAISDLSRRPDPDVTGAIQHAIAGLECVVKEVTGNKNDSLGKLMNDNKGIVPPPLDKAIHRFYGFVSNNGRHIEEGNPPALEEAELTVSLSTSLITYLAKKNFGAAAEPTDLPW